MEDTQSTWQTVVILIARLIFAAMFAMGWPSSSWTWA